MMLIVLEIDVLDIINGYIYYTGSALRMGYHDFSNSAIFVIFCNKYASFSYIFISLKESFADIPTFFGYPKFFLR